MAVPTIIANSPIITVQPSTGAASIITQQWPSVTVSPVGMRGPPGEEGAPGNTILNGSGAPSNDIGVNGDFYYDTAGQFIYGPKASGVWPVGVRLGAMDWGKTYAAKAFFA